MTITSLQTIQAHAEKAAQAGELPAGACPYPPESPEAFEWFVCYAEAADFAAQNTYREALSGLRCMG